MRNDLLFPLAVVSGFSLLSLSFITAAELIREERKLHERLTTLTHPAHALAS